MDHLMSPPSGNSTALAVLIDADNARPAIVQGLLNEIAKLGIASVKRIYGDWTTPNLAAWKQTLLEYSIQPIQQFRYTTGKNATDSAMIIDAMDLLFQGHFGGFCLVSSDSDFTRLASRIRESGLQVYGFGEHKTPRPFVAACDRFIYTEVFVTSIDTEVTPTVSVQPAKQLRSNTKLLCSLREAIEASADDTGWASLGVVGSQINKLVNDFDPRSYGYSKLSELIKAIGLFGMEWRGNLVFIKDDRKK